jgi:hypothetical protein
MVVGIFSLTSKIRGLKINPTNSAGTYVSSERIRLAVYYDPATPNQVTFVNLGDLILFEDGSRHLSEDWVTISLSDFVKKSTNLIALEKYLARRWHKSIVSREVANGNK